MDLSKCELEVMDVFWNLNTPLSRKDLLEHQEEKTWKDSSVHILINSLLKKGIIEKSGMVKRVKTVARTFVPTMTREQYYAANVFSHRYRPEVYGVLEEMIRKNPLTSEEIVGLQELLSQKA